MPAPPAVGALAEALGEPAELARARPVRQVRGDHVRGLVEAREAVRERRHEGPHALGARHLDPRRDVDQHDGGGDARRLAFDDHRGDAAERGADDDRRARERRRDRTQIGRERVDRVVAVLGIPGAVAVTAGVERDRVPAGAGDRASGAAPGMTRLATAGEQDDRRRRRIAPGVAGERHAGVAGEADDLMRRNHRGTLV